MVATATPTRLYAGAADLAATAPAVRASTSNAGAAQTALTFTIPAGVVAGDLLFTSLGMTVNPASLTLPAGWTLLTSNTVTGQFNYIYTKVVTTTDLPGATVTLTSGTSLTYTIVCTAISGSDLNQPYVLGPTNVAAAAVVTSSAFTSPMFGLGLVFVTTGSATSTPAGWTLVTSNTTQGPGTFLYSQSFNTQSFPSATYTASTQYTTVPLMIGGPPQATPSTTRYTSASSGSTTTITEVECINDNIYGHTFRVVAGGNVLIPGLYVPAKGVSQYQLRSVMGTSETLLVSANGPSCSIAAHGVVTT